MNYQEDESRPDDEGIERYLAALAVPPMPEDLPARCRSLVAANDANASSGTGNARPRPLILLGALLAAGAAAAMLIMQFAPAPDEVATVQASVPEAAEATVEERKFEPVVAVPVVSAAEVRKTPTTPVAGVPKPFAVRVLPLQNGAQDAPGRLAIEDFYASLLDRLRAVPGLTLITSQSTGIAEDAPTAYEVSVKGYGSVAAGKWNVDMKAQVLSAGEGRHALGHVLAVVPFSVRGSGETCAGNQVSTAVMPCSDPASMASSLVDMMRNALFPVDAVVASRVRAQLLDSSLDPAARLHALEQMRLPRLIIADEAAPDGAVARLARPTLDDAAMAGALELAATAPDPVTRASAWKELRGLHHPAVIEALVKAMQHDDSNDVSLQVTTMLAEDFLADPGAASALRSATRDHPAPLVRMIAQRAITGGAAGDALWRDYVINTLKDSSLPAGQRLDPFIYMVASDRTPDARNIGAFLDDDALKALVAVFPSAWSSGRDAERLARPLVNALQLARGPAVVDLYAEILRHAIDPMTRSIAARELAREYRDDPRTRTALELVAASDPNPDLRKLAGDALQREPAPIPK